MIGALVAIALCACCAIAIILLTGVFSRPEPTAVPPQVAPTLPPSTGVVDDSWERVKAAGQMVVGTAADYPPFEYYVREGEIDGFDIALMDEIGRRLGVAIEYRDYAFDGLGRCLQLGQLDAAIAAISVTPERQARWTSPTSTW